jgi:hypothetical protein
MSWGVVRWEWISLGKNQSFLRQTLECGSALADGSRNNLARTDSQMIVALPLNDNTRAVLFTQCCRGFGASESETPRLRSPNLAIIPGPHRTNPATPTAHTARANQECR